MSLTPEAIKTLSRVSTATSPRSSSKRACETSGCGARDRCGRDNRGWSGRHLRCVSCPRGRILGDAGIMVVADFDPDGDRSHA